MKRREIKSTAKDKPAFHAGRLWLWLSIAAALLAVAGNIIALSVPSIYAVLTPVFLTGRAGRHT